MVAGLGGGRQSYPPPFIAALVEAGFHVVTYDHRDVGASTRFPDAETARSPFRGLMGGGTPAYTAEAMTDDAVAVMDAMGWPTAHVFGLSMSAMPSDAGPLGSLRHLHLGFIRATSRLDFPDTPEGDVETAMAVARLCASPAYPLDEAEMRSWLEQASVDGVRDGTAQARQLRAPWNGPRLRTLTTPTLVLHGDADPVGRTSAARAIAREVPAARLVILPGVGHELPRPLWPTLVGHIRDNADRAAVPA
jgi:pimeloyl-ACP methyl ester carboxylesterase